MRRTLSVTHWLLTWLCAGCVTYVAPGPTEPHALLKVRRVYHGAVRAPAWMQTRREQVSIDGALWLLTEENAEQRAPQTQAVRVAPGLRVLEVFASFEHDEQRHSRKSVMKSEPYTETEGYWEGMAYKTRSVSKTRWVPKDEWVWETVEVTDDKCYAHAPWHFMNGGVYLVQYTFTGLQHCSLVCLEQWRAAPGEPVQVRPCPDAAASDPSAVAACPAPPCAAGGVAPLGGPRKASAGRGPAGSSAE